MTKAKQITDADIKAWIKLGEPFEGRRVSQALYLRYTSSDATPVWRYRYSFAGKPRVMVIGNYTNLSLKEAKDLVKTLSARVTLGFDVAREKQSRIKEATLEAELDSYTVSKLADEFFAKRVMGVWKYPNIVRSRIEKDIKPVIGKLRVDEVTPKHINKVIEKVLERGARTTANDVLRWLKRLFDHAIKHGRITYNPAAAFDVHDAGGEEKSRDVFLSEDEIKLLFSNMKTARGFSYENELTIKLLLALCVRKGELIGANWKEFDFDKMIWHLPMERSKTGVKIMIPLTEIVAYWLSELKRLGGGSEWVLPARKIQWNMIPHISPDTLNAALGKVRVGLKHFTVHDLRRTSKTLLGLLKVPPHISERCLNHKIRGVEGIYDAYDYFDERKDALNKLSDRLVLLGG